MSIDQNTITFVLGLAAVVSIIFHIYERFRNPQIKSDSDASKLRSDVEELKKVVSEIKETHLRTVENDIKNLTTSVNELSKTVVRLATIIDERIPKGNPNLTAPGV